MKITAITRQNRLYVIWFEIEVDEEGRRGSDIDYVDRRLEVSQQWRTTDHTKADLGRKPNVRHQLEFRQERMTAADHLQMYCTAEKTSDAM